MSDDLYRTIKAWCDKHGKAPSPADLTPTNAQVIAHRNVQALTEERDRLRATIDAAVHELRNRDNTDYALAILEGETGGDNVRALVEALEAAEVLYQIGLINAPVGLIERANSLRTAALAKFKESADA